MTAIDQVRAEGNYTEIDHVVYDLMQEIRRIGTRVQQAILDYDAVVQAATEALRAGERPYGGIHTPDNPVQLLRDMEPLCEIARKLGVPQDAITKSRQGLFVSHREFLPSEQPADINLNRK